MNKQDQFMKIQTFVLRVNIHCDGCKQKVRKIIQKFDGVYSTSIDSEQSKVTVSGSFNPEKLIKKLEKSGKHAELWGSQKGHNNNHNNNQANFNNQFKNMQVGDGFKGDKNNKNNNNNNNNNKSQSQKGVLKEQPKSGHQAVQFHQHGGNNKGGGNNNNNNKAQKTVKFSKADPDEFDMSDRDFDEYSDDFDDDDEFDEDDEDFSDEDEEFGHGHGHGHNQGHFLPNKGVNSVNVMPKVMQGNGHGNGKMNPMMMSGGNGLYGPNKNMINVHGINDKNSVLGGNNGNGNGGGFKKGGVIDFPMEMKGKKSEGKNNSNKGGKKGGNGGEGKGKGDVFWNEYDNINNNNNIGTKKQMSGHGEKKKTGLKKEKGGGGGLLGMFGFGKKKKSGIKGGASVPKKGSSNNDVSIDAIAKGINGKKGAAKNGKGKNEGGHNNNNKERNSNDQFEMDFSSGKEGKGNKGGGKMGHMGSMGRGGDGNGGRSLGPMGPTGPMGNYPNAHMGGFQAVQGLPAQPVMSGGGYYQGMMGHVPGYGGGPTNPYSQQQLHQQQLQLQQQQQQQQQQQYMAMMMNQQRGINGNEMFQPMMYAKSHPTVNYAPPPSHSGNDNLTHFFSDENTESCNIM